MVLQAIRYSPAKDSSEASLEILDQLALPHRSAYFAIHTCEDAHAAIRQMRVRGAPAIAIVAALALAVQLDHELKHDLLPSKAEEVVQLISHRLEYLITSRPTAVNLADAVGKLKIVSRKAGQVPEVNPKHVVDQYINTAKAMLVQDVKDNEAIGEHGAKWIIDRRKGRPDSLQVLTHCNTGYVEQRLQATRCPVTWKTISG
jgi:methylthioribose-1-phosphate isomerase